MGKYAAGDSMKAETVDSIMGEFHTFLNDAAGVLGYALTGVQLSSLQFEASCKQFGDQASGVPVEMTVLVDGEDASRVETFHVWRQDAVRENLADGGLVQAQIGHQWLLMVFHAWEDEYRPRLAVARQMSIAEVSDPVLGDLRHMRNDIVHHRGVATQKNSGRCEQLKWFKAGERMVIDRQMVWQIMNYFGLTFPAPEEGRPYYLYRTEF
ncbi:hypothetical protein [Pseudonocardia sp. ICBG162]|uniref:hypothetical protein n=1 Tax=Pseudonocardia sp. ICBG162 TaxID=2846761 RepID=UPI001CF6AC4C|nr:hypothetical protein [Pseudonocardia sp. ICBG162]